MKIQQVSLFETERKSSLNLLSKEQFTFIDLFAGIGGFRLGMEKAGFECVFSSEIDEHACEMYEKNYGENPYCDVTKLDAKIIPDFDVLCAGFPCQSFSISGKQRGFYDQTRGTLFFDICRILEEKKPRAFILENVKNLSTHDKGRTLSVMLDSLTKLGYVVQYKVLNAKDFGVPQNRERIFLVGNRENKYFDFEKLSLNPVESMDSFLDEGEDFQYLSPEEYTILDDVFVKRQQSSGLMFNGYRNKKIRTRGTRPNTEHLSRVHKQPNRIYSTKGVHPTLSSQESSGRFFIYDGKNVRKLTLDECFRFMGFPEKFIKIGTDSKLYNRVGNSVCVNVVEKVALELSLMLRGEIVMNEKNPNLYLEEIYKNSMNEKVLSSYILTEEQKNNIKMIVAKESVNKGVYTALITSLVYKKLYPEQDVRLHQVSLIGGYSGRSFDTKWITPFLKRKRFLGAMKESGWLTRSIEQNHAFNLEFPGRITPRETKSAFLTILDDIETFSESPEKYLIHIFHNSILEKEKHNIVINNPVNREAKLNIDEIIELLEKHFSYNYSTRGGSILPVIAFYSIYQSLIREVSRYKNKSLDELASHYSSDKNSGNSGDIVVRTSEEELYEVVEVKYDIRVDEMIVMDAINKIKPNKELQRYYILSTVEPTEKEKDKFQYQANKLSEEHGCQLIINGLIKTVNYYLRLIENTDDFIMNYVENLGTHPEIQPEQRIVWNGLVEGREKK